MKNRKFVQVLQEVHNKKFAEEMKGVEKDHDNNNNRTRKDQHEKTTENTEISGGFFVSPITNCPHVESLKEIPEKGDTKSACLDCGNVGENWMCLTCSKVFCSRYVKGDMARHCGRESHPVVVSFSDFSTWCYECDSYISNPRLIDLLKSLHASKFGFEPRPNSNNSTTTTTTTTSTSSSRGNIIGTGFNGAPTTYEEVEELHESPEELLKKVKQVAELIRNSEHFVAYTGAGISTSANLPDYRGPNGVWTLASQGKRLPPGITLEQALPTPGHMALKVLQDRGILKFLVSTNVDGLHRRSGIPEEQIAELHGNIYREKCEKCSKEFLRPFDVTKSQFGLTRKTGRKCTSCGGDLRDTIINFGENLPMDALTKSYEHSEKADVRLVLGTSMRVSPANKLPLEGLKEQTQNKSKKSLIIVNLQRTPYDSLAKIRIFAKTDEFFGYLMRELRLPIPVFELSPQELAKEMEI